MSRKLVSSFLTPSPLLNSSAIAEIVKAVPEDLNKNISTFSPVCLRKEVELQPSTNHDRIILQINTGKKSGNWRGGKELPPLPLESELFTPPVDKGNRAERSISVLAETFLSMMPSQGKKVVMIKETANMMNTSPKRVYTICNVLEGLRFMERKGQNMYEWKGRKLLMPTMMLLMQMALNENMVERIRNVITSEDSKLMQQLLDQSEIRKDPDHFMALNICMLTQKLMMVFMALPPPKVISLPDAATVIHGAGVKGKQRNVCLQKLWDVSKILQEVGLIQKVTIRQGSEKPVLAYQYVGEKVELVTVERVSEAVASPPGDENDSEVGKGDPDFLNDENKITDHEGKSDCLSLHVEENSQSSKVKLYSVGVKVKVDDKVVESGEASQVEDDQQQNRSSVLVDEDMRMLKLRLVLDDEVCMMEDC